MDHISEQNSGLVILSGITLGLIPGKVVAKQELFLFIQDNLGSELKKITRTGGIEVTIQLFLIFLMPFDFPYGKEDELRENMIASAVSEAVESIK